MKIFYLLFLVFLFMSCAERGNEEKKVMILGVTPEQIVELKGEELPIQELIPTSICRLDSFLVILNMEEEKIVRVYQADTYRFLGAFLEKGRGDDEVISCQEIWAAPWKGKMRLWLKAPQNFIGVVDLESSLTAGKPCWEKQYKFMDRGMADFLYRPVFVLNDSVFWISRAERPYDIIPNQNIRKNADGSIRILSMQGTTHVGGKNLYWLSYNYASATVLDSVWYTDYDDIRDFDQLFLGDEAMSPDRRRIAVAFRNMNQIILYDSKMQNFRWLTTDNELPLLNSSESFGENYSGVDCTDKAVFAYRAFPEDPRRPVKLGFSVEVFDWEGTFKFQLKLSHPLKYPFLDAEKGFLYATDEEDCIRKYDVRDFL